MKIGQLDNQPSLAPLAGERKPATPSAPTEGVQASAKVDLSQSQALASGMRSETSFDQAKVDRIAQAIRDGSYKINPDAIADRLIANAQELLGRSGR